MAFIFFNLKIINVIGGHWLSITNTNYNISKKMAENNNQIQGGAQAPAVRNNGLDATGNFVATVRAEENRHSEAVAGIINTHFEKFGAGLCDFVNGLINRASTSMPNDSFLGAAITVFKDYNSVKTEGRKADLKHMEAEDQIKLLEAQERLVAAQNTAKQLDLQLAEVNRDKAEAEARVSERYGNFASKLMDLENKFDGTTTGPCPATPERKLTKNA